MAKEILLYDPIFDFTAERFVQQMEEVGDQDVIIRVNSGGGSVFAGWSIANKIKNHAGNTTIVVEGQAYSMAVSGILPFANKRIALNVSDLMIHKGKMYVENEDDEKRLKRYNDSLKAALNASIDSDKLKEISGYSLDEVFASYDDKASPDVFLSAQEAKEIGLIDEVEELTAEKRNAINQRVTNHYATATPISQHTPPNNKPPKKTIMDINELKSNHPDLYNQVKESGVTEERDRVMAWNVFNSIDSKAVAEGIKSGKPVSQSQMSEFQMKFMAQNRVKNMEDETEGNTASPEDSTEPTETPKSEHEKELTAFHNQLKALRNK